MQHPDLLVGFNTGDDAAVWRLTPELCVVQTVDFFTPIVDDAYTFGQIAAANALSDVYAMGGRPLTALNIVTFPVGQLDISILRETIRGGLDKIHEAGVVLVGGHSASWLAALNPHCYSALWPIHTTIPTRTSRHCARPAS